MGERAGIAGQGGEALDQALGLLRAPALRTALRTRPLPDGIGELLAVASGTSDVTREAIARTGSSEAELVEASRFYVQQVLLADGADAYRNLGAAPDTGHAVLREHHHLLMRWLHPDRSEDAQWDSALSIRVNQAWNQLRTPAARARYDAGQVPVPAAHPAATAASAIPLPITYVALQPPRPIPTGPIAVAFLAIACLALAWLAVTREDRMDELRDASRFQGAGVDVSQRMAAPLPQVLEGLPVPAPAPAPAPETVPTEPVGDGPLEAGTVAVVDDTPPSAGAVAHAGLEQPSPSQGLVAAGEGGRGGSSGLAAAAEIPADPPATRGAHALDGPITANATPAPATSADPLQLFRDAEAAIASVSAYFSSARGGEPLWLDLPVSLEAAALRQDLHARHGAGPRGRMSVEHPNWTLGTESASMSGAYRFGRRRGTAETGVLHVGLERRGDHWRVARLHLDPAR